MVMIKGLIHLAGVAQSAGQRQPQVAGIGADGDPVPQ